MEEWRTYKLGDILTIKYGKDHKSLSDGPVPAFGSGGVMRYVEKPIFDKPSILIPRKGSLNNVVYIDMPFWTVDTMFWTIIDTNIVIPHFLYYSIRDIDFASLNVGSAVPSLTCPVIESIEVSIPSLDTQMKILDFLEPLDDKIAINKRINHNLEKQVQDRFNALIAEDNGAGFCQLSDVIDVNPSRKLSKKTMARCIEMSYLSTNGSFPSGWEYKEYNGGMKFINGDTIMARITPCLENGKVAYINFLDSNEVGFGSTEYIVLRSKEQLPSEFTYFLARNPDFVDYAVKNMNGSSGRQRVSSDSIAKYIIPAISSDSIRSFSEIAKSAMAIFRTNCLENRSLVETRDTLLPALMKGELPCNN